MSEKRQYEICYIHFRDGSEKYLFMKMRNIHFENDSIWINEDGDNGTRWVFPISNILSVEWLPEERKGVIG